MAKFYVYVTRTTTYEVPNAKNAREAANLVFGEGDEGADFREVDSTTDEHFVQDENYKTVKEEDE